ncbi:hypothetical protein CON13_17760 [Bacillus cereus]|uniref:hypothetical protein n=1 Tax=Bacillus cereus TaxID=1396 RepID=UPI000BEC2989|nr:hypothetical protein [Bacillus cereus]PED30736.1 hypothetical protein CON13_17760 [Bacillus cereus]PEE49946.1 hypothetical protein COM80_27650 [Bacillus cereus]PFL89115.1 hypothetical protein COJ35_27325 [Bacillus cereus]
MQKQNTDSIGFGAATIHDTIEKVTDNVFSVRVQWDGKVHPVSVDLEQLEVSPGLFQEKYNKQPWAVREAFNERVRKYVQAYLRKVDS